MYLEAVIWRTHLDAKLVVKVLNHCPCPSFGIVFELFAYALA